MIKDLEKAFIYKEYSNVNWDNILFYISNKLDEETIDYFSDKVNWRYISKYQTLSEEFIDKYDL